MNPNIEHMLLDPACLEPKTPLLNSFINSNSSTTFHTKEKIRATGGASYNLAKLEMK